MELSAYLFLILSNLWYSLGRMSLHTERTRTVGREGRENHSKNQDIEVLRYFFELGGIETQNKGIVTRQNPIVYQ